ncbi:MAG: hypothetical protein LBU84_05795 [Prevotella sp.]|jgi:hypothetical protein|nr:hypothetical protein [Prevotella sp.]
MNDYRKEEEIMKEKLPEEKDNVNVRFAIAIEELCSDDFSFDDEINTNE